MVTFMSGEDAAGRTEKVMINNSKQKWEIGQQVNVGFLKGLTVVAKVLTPGDYAPDAYVLTRGAKFYSFVPHNGLMQISPDEAAGMIEEGKRAKAKQDAEQDDDLVTVGIWDGVGLINPEDVQEEKVYKIDFTKMLEAEKLASKAAS